MDKKGYVKSIFQGRYFPIACILLLLQSVQTWYVPIFAQIEGNPRIKHFTFKDGLSQATVNDLIIESTGFAWLATEDGLNRFDGTKFKHYRYNEENPTSISGNVLNTLAEDNQGDIWVGTIGNGLNRYNKDLDTFSRIKLTGEKNENSTISDIHANGNESVWVTTRKSGLYRLQKGQDSLIIENYLPNHRLRGLLIDKEHNLWVGGFTGEVYRVNIKNESLHFSTPELNLEGYIQAFYHSGKNLLIGSDHGLFIYNLQSKTVELIELEDVGEQTTRHVVAFLEEDDSKVWVGTGNGLFLFDHVNRKTLRKIKYQLDGNGLSTNTVYSLARLSDYQILVGTAGHLNLIDFSQPYFSNISKDRSGQRLLNDNVVLSILKDGKDLWVGTADGGLNLIRNGKAYYFLENPNFPKILSGSALMGIAKDHKNQTLWLATTRGLCLLDLKNFDPQNPRFRIFRHEPENPNSINIDYVTHVLLDNKDNLWGTTYGEGIFRLEMLNNGEIQITRYYNKEESSNSLANNFAYGIEQDRNGSFWIATEGGLSSLHFNSENYEGPHFKNYIRHPKRSNSLSNNSVVDIYIDKKDRVWAGTRHGLNLYLGEDKFESWIEERQFPNAVVFSIQGDNAGMLWLGTNNGLVKFNPKEKSFSHYGIEDGIQGPEFNISAKSKDDKGNIFLGGIDGFLQFNPSILNDIDKSKPLYFSKLRVKDKIINSNDKGLLHMNLTKARNLEFNYNDFPFYLQFSSIDFRLEKNVKYGYKLLPMDTEWNMLNNSEIQFLNLPPGNHTLLVNGFSRGKKWEQAPLKIDLWILPPWWASGWAYALYVGLAGMFAYGLYGFQFSRKLAMAESKRLTEVNQLKSSLYTNITHEFRTPLTVILGMADTAKSIIANKHLKSAEESLEMIRRNGKNLLRLVNELLDLAKLESGNMELRLVQGDVVPFVKYLCESFHSLAKGSQIDLVVYSEIDTLVMDFDTENLSTVLSNLLTNAIKFTLPGGKIVVHLNKTSKNDKTHLFIRVKDTGMGISEEALPNIFNRFYQEDASASRKGEGTGIGLALTMQLVELMKGDINVKSALGNGSEFTVFIPITKNAPKIVDVPTSYEPQMHLEPIKQNSFEELSGNDTELPIVLIIEDNADVTHYLKTCLKGKYKTLHAPDGIIGIEMAFEIIPDIIICDVMMPGKDGYEVCSTLKTDERTDHIPIVMLTAKATLQDRITGLSHGADAYLAKPFNKAELFTRIDQLILLRKKMMHKLEKEGFGSFLKKRTENLETKFLQKAIKLIHEEIGDHSFGSKQLAQKLYLSESQVYRKLKAITGKSTAIFIRSVRLQKAKELIQTTDSTISETAYAVGFNDPSWFSRAFKEEFGFAPSGIAK